MPALLIPFLVTALQNAQGHCGIIQSWHLPQLGLSPLCSVGEKTKRILCGGKDEEGAIHT